MSTRKLSPRELEVVGLFAAGLKSVEVAQSLGIGARTISTHKARIRRKLGIVTKTAWRTFLIPGSHPST